MSLQYALIASVAADDDLANGQIISWDLQNGVCLPQHVWREAAVQDGTLLSSPSNPLMPSHLISTAVRTSALLIHSLQKERPVARWYGHERVCAVAGSPDGRWLVGGNEMGGMMVWEVETGRMWAQLADAHLRRVNRIVFSADGNFVVSAGEDGFAKVWSLDALLSGSTTASMSFSDHTSGVTDIYIGFGRSPARLLTCSSDNSCILYDLADGALLARYIFPAALTRCLMNAMETLILAASTDGNVYLVDLSIDSQDLAQDSSLVVSSTGGRKEQKLVGMSGAAITQMAFSSDESVLVTGDLSGKLSVWNVASRMTIRQINAASMVPNGSIRWLAIIPRASLTRSEPLRSFGQLRRAIDLDAPASIDTILTPKYTTAAAKEKQQEQVVQNGGDNKEEELEKLRTENLRLREAHQKLLDSIQASL